MNHHPQQGAALSDADILAIRKKHPAAIVLDGEALNFASDILAAADRLTAEQGGADLADMASRKDAAYLERNQVVAALAKAFPSGVARTAIEGWSDDWHGCVYINLPTGQASWHFHDSQAYLFEGLPPYAGQWDGHTTEEKYERLAALTTQPQAEHVATVTCEGVMGVSFTESCSYGCDLPIGTKLYLTAQPQAAEPAAWRDVQAERVRQVSAEGWTPEHDDEHNNGAMARAAAVYAITGSSDGRDALDNGATPSVQERLWPWSWSWFKPTNRRRNLVKAGALILAEIERLDHATPTAPTEPT